MFAFPREYPEKWLQAVVASGRCLEVDLAQDAEFFKISALSGKQDLRRHFLFCRKPALICRPEKTTTVKAKVERTDDTVCDAKRTLRRMYVL